RRGGVVCGAGTIAIVWVGGRAGAEETVAVGSVLITALPAGVGRIVAAMLHREEVAYRIVEIALDIRAHRVAVARVIEVRMDVIKRVRRGGRIGLAPCLP